MPTAIFTLVLQVFDNGLKLWNTYIEQRPTEYRKDMFEEYETLKKELYEQENLPVLEDQTIYQPNTRYYDDVTVNDIRLRIIDIINKWNATVGTANIGSTPSATGPN